MKVCALFIFVFSLSAAASEETFSVADVVRCSTSNGILVGQIISLRSDTAANVEWMSGDAISTDFNLQKSCVNITNWSNSSERSLYR
jgi:hypothetical protein